MHEHERWLHHASNDLATAKILKQNPELGTVTYHTQQCAEKALKAYLVYHGTKIERNVSITKNSSIRLGIQKLRLNTSLDKCS